jgi:RNA polymerase sigma factor (sigma-70 family)
MPADLPLHDWPEGDLERLAAEGDQDAFAEIYERYSQRVYDFLVRIVRDDDEAADLMQETFIRAMKSLSTERAGRAALSTWLFTIARNLALNRLERSKRTTPLAADPNDDDSEEYWQVDVASADDPGEAAQVHEMAALVWAAAEALDQKQYSVLDLHVRQGLDSAEIAEVLGVSKGNAYTMVSRLKDTFEVAVTALIMMKSGRRSCAELDALLTERAVTVLSPPARKLIQGHVSHCFTCQDQRKQLVSAEALLRSLVPVPLPLAFKARIGRALSQAAHPASAAASGAGAAVSQSAGGSLLGSVVTSGVSKVLIVTLAVVGVATPAAIFVAPRVDDMASAIRDLVQPSGGVSGEPSLCTPVQATFVASSTRDDQYAANVLAESNKYRADRGQPALIQDDRLVSAAAEYAEFVVNTRWWTMVSGTSIHTGADGCDMFDRAAAYGYSEGVGENVMWGDVRLTPTALFAGLIDGGFYEDPAKPEFAKTGVACYVRSTAPAELSCVQVFGALSR